MENNGTQPRPAVILAMGTLMVGLASFIVWLLRLKPPAAKQDPGLQGAGTSPGTDRATDPASVAPSPSPTPPAGSGGPTRAAEGQPAAPVRSKADTTWSAPSRYMAGAGLVLAFFGLVYYSRQTLSLLIFAALIAILARPAMGFLQRRLRFSPGLSVIVTYIGITVLLFAIPLLILPNLIESINSLLNVDWPGILDKLAAGLEQAASQTAGLPIIGGFVSNSIQSLADFSGTLVTGIPETEGAEVTVQSLISDIGQAVGLLAKVLGPLVSGVLSLIFLLLISLQMSLAGDQVRGWIMKLVPPPFEAEINGLLDRISLVWVSFLRGQFALMVVMGVLVWLMNWLLGTPQPLLLGLLAGLLEIIPSLGPTLAAIPAALLALLFGSAHFPGLDPVLFMLVVIAGYVLLNLLENQVLVPQILGDAVDLPPLIVLVGVTIAGVQAGIAGIFLATPVIATGRELFEYLYAKIREVPDVEPATEPKPSLRDQLRGLIGRIRLPTRRAAGAAQANQ